MGVMMQTYKAKETKQIAETQYLLNPTGTYNIGYQESAELAAKIYYPSLERRQEGMPHPQAQKLKTDGTGLEGITQEELNSLDAIKTPSTEGLTIAPGSFPVIIFSPGSDTGSDHYQNLICHLVSNGYIVIGRDNVDPAKGAKGAFEEVIFIQKKLAERHMRNISSAMNLAQIGLLGHSLGAGVSIKAAHEHPKVFQCIVALDAPVFVKPSKGDTLSDGWNVRRGFKLPSLQIHASTWRRDYSGGETRELSLNPFNYHALLAPNLEDIDYSGHANFDDRSTLQYHPIFPAFDRHLVGLLSQYPGLMRDEILDRTNPLQIGRKINGYDAAKTINNYVGQFFDAFLKKQPDLSGRQIFPEGNRLDGTLMRSGIVKISKASIHSSAAMFSAKQPEEKQSAKTHRSEQDGIGTHLLQTPVEQEEDGNSCCIIL